MRPAGTADIPPLFVSAASTGYTRSNRSALTGRRGIRSAELNAGDELGRDVDERVDHRRRRRHRLGAVASLAAQAAVRSSHRGGTRRKALGDGHGGISTTCRRSGGRASDRPGVDSRIFPWTIDSTVVFEGDGRSESTANAELVGDERLGRAISEAAAMCIAIKSVFHRMSRFDLQRWFDDGR